jgi:hypothetical protein
MKRLSLIVVFFMLPVMALTAQDSNFGFRAGPSFTTLGGDDSDSFNFTVGYHFGVYLNFPIQDKLSFEPGLQWATKGAGSDFIGLSGDARLRNSYLDLPLLLKFNAGETAYLFIGAQPSILVNATVIVRENGNKVTVDGKDVRDLYEGFDFAGIIGFGFNLGQGMNLQVNYDHGFANISAAGGSSYNRGIKFSLGKTF